MILYIFICIWLVGKVSVVVCNNNFTETQWKHSSVRKSLNTSIVAAKFVSESTLECSVTCSHLPEVDEAPSFYYEPERKQCHCNLAHDDSHEDPDLPEMIYGVMTSFAREYRVSWNRVSWFTIWPYKSDCYSLKSGHWGYDGVHTILPEGATVPIEAYCEMDSGWTRIQLLSGGVTDFNRGIDDYVRGFGLAYDDHWLGLENMHLLTNQQPSMLKILVASYRINIIATYANFSVGDNSTNYRLYVSGFSGDCGDSLSVHSGSQFYSAFGNMCGELFGGGWWFNQPMLNNSTHGYNLTQLLKDQPQSELDYFPPENLVLKCGDSCLNGKTSDYGFPIIIWKTCHGFKAHWLYSQMSVKPNNADEE